MIEFQTWNIFCDTGKELKETYEFIDKLEAYLNAHVIRLPKELPGFSESYDFDHFVELFNGYLPSPSNRWCTKKLKLGPFEHYIGDDTVKNYVGIRADEAGWDIYLQNQMWKQFSHLLKMESIKMVYYES